MMIGPAEDARIMLLEFEHDSGMDTDGYPAPEDILERKTSYFESLDDVVKDLKRRGIDTNAFDAPWKFDYPL